MGGSTTVKVADSERTVWEKYLEKFEVDRVGADAAAARPCALRAAARRTSSASECVQGHRP